MFIDSEKLNDRLKSGSHLPKSPTITPKTINRIGDTRGIHPNSQANIQGDEITRGRKPGDKTLSDNVRATAGAIARISGAGESAKVFDLSSKAVTFARDGKVTNDETPRPDLEEKIQDILNPIRNKAIERMLVGLGELSDAKMKFCKAGELSKVLSNLSNVIKNCTVAPTEISKNQATQVVIYGPQQKPENDYKVIEVG